MNDREELAKGIDAVTIALRDISLRLKEAPDLPPEKKFPCPACGAEHQSNVTKVMHVASKHPDWIVFRNPDLKAAKLALGVKGEVAPEVLESRFVPAPVESVRRPLVSLDWLKKKEEYVKPREERDWSKVAIGAVVVVVVLLVVAALLL